MSDKENGENTSTSAESSIEGLFTLYNNGIIIVIIGTTELTVKQVKKILKDILLSHFAGLSDQLRLCLHQVTTKMYSCALISKSVRDSPTVYSVIDEFENGLQYKDDVLKLQEHCQLFLQCLSSEGGPMTLAAKKLCQDWMEEINKQCNVNLDLELDVTQGQYIKITHTLTYMVVQVLLKKQTGINQNYLQLNLLFLEVIKLSKL